MAVTNFVGGLTVDGVPVGGPLTTGRVFFVDNSKGGNSNSPAGGSAATPFNTLAYAISRATAARGDVIIVGAAHSESIATAVALTHKSRVTFLFLATGETWMMSSVTGALRTAGAADRLIRRAISGFPATTTMTLFTVTGGPVLVRDIFGIITTVVQTQANNTKLTAVATGLTGVDLCAVLSITAAAVGTHLSITGTLANAMIASPNQTRIAQATPIVVGPGTILLDCAATNTGAAQWFLRYQPLSPGALVMAA